jgi:membrane-bound metal-dependent hydrolase YbcI (DUF457 family)
MFSSKSLREELRSKPRLFLIITLGAIAPDFDLIFQTIVLSLPDVYIFSGLRDFFSGSHRVWSHTFFAPLLVMMLAGPISKLKRSDNNWERNIRLFAFMWLTHLFFDLTFGPLALFYPLDDRFYDVRMGINVGLEGNYIIPLTLTGFFADVRFIGSDTGSSSFFVNWTPEQRISYFGSDETKVDVTNFWLHVVIFIYYVYIVLLPFVISEKRNLRSYSNKYAPDRRLSRLFINVKKTIDYSDTKYSNFVPKIRKFYNKRNGWYAQIILVLLIVTSFYGGPYYGKYWEDDRTEFDNFYTLSDGFKFFSTKTFNVPSDSILKVKLTYDDGSLPIQVFGMIIDRSLAIDFTLAFNERVEEYDDNLIDYNSLLAAYVNLLNVYISLSSVSDLNLNHTVEWNFESNEELTIISGLYSWDASYYFIRNPRFELNWRIPRTDSYNNGIFLIILFSLVLFVSLTRNPRKAKIPTL